MGKLTNHPGHWPEEAHQTEFGALKKILVSTFILKQIKQNEKNTMMNVFNFMFFFVCLLLTHVTYSTWTAVFRKKFLSAPSLSKYYEPTLDCVLVNNTVVCNCLNTKCFMWCQIPATKFMFWSCNSLIHQDQSQPRFAVWKLKV